MLKGDTYATFSYLCPANYYGFRSKTMVTKLEMGRRNDCSTNKEPQILFYKGRIFFLYLMLCDEGLGEVTLDSVDTEEINKTFFKVYQ